MSLMEKLSDQIDYVVMTRGSGMDHFRGWVTFHDNLEDAKTTAKNTYGTLYQRSKIDGQYQMTEIMFEFSGD